MKLIHLRDGSDFKSRDIIDAVVDATEPPLAVRAVA